jgi:hypothetical protein
MKYQKKILISLSIMAVCLLFLAVGCTVSEVVTRPDGTKQTVHKVDPALSGGAATTEAIGAVVPQPYGWMVGAIAAAAAAVGQGIANYKNKREAQAQATKAEQIADIATTIIQGVEAAGAEAARVKESIANRAKSDGNYVQLDALVQKELN